MTTPPAPSHPAFLHHCRALPTLDWQGEHDKTAPASWPTHFWRRSGEVMFRIIYRGAVPVGKLPVFPSQLNVS